MRLHLIVGDIPIFNNLVSFFLKFKILLTVIFTLILNLAGPATLCSTVDARVTFNNTGSISMASKAIETNPIDDTSVTLRTSVMDDSWMYDSALNVDRRDLMCTHSQVGHLFLSCLSSLVLSSVNVLWFSIV